VTTHWESTVHKQNKYKVTYRNKQWHHWLAVRCYDVSPCNSYSHW